jgi:acetyl esterase/lipase
VRSRHVPRRLRPRRPPVWALSCDYPVTPDQAQDLKAALRRAGVWPAVVLAPGLHLARFDSTRSRA